MHFTSSSLPACIRIHKTFSISSESIPNTSELINETKNLPSTTSSNSTYSPEILTLKNVSNNYGTNDSIKSFENNISCHHYPQYDYQNTEHFSNNYDYKFKINSLNQHAKCIKSKNSLVENFKKSLSLSLVYLFTDAHNQSDQRCQENNWNQTNLNVDNIHEWYNHNNDSISNNYYTNNNLNELRKSDNADTKGLINAEKNIPTWVAGWNVLNIIQGIGILAIPYTCVQAGWIFIPTILVTALICGFTGRILGECLYRYPEQDCENYFNSQSQMTNRVRVRSTNACIAADIIPCCGHQFVSLIVLLEVFGAGVLYIILMGESASALINNHMSKSWPLAYWITMMAYLNLPILLFPRMRIVAWFSIIALLGLFSTILIIFLYCILEAWNSKISWSNLPSPNPKYLPISLSIIIFSYCVHSVLPGIESSMKYPQSYNKMINISFSIAGLNKLIFGLFCTIIFGQNITQSLIDNITNRPYLTIMLNLSVLLNVFFSLPLVFHILGEQFDCVIAKSVNLEFFLNKKLFSHYTIWFLSSRIASLNLALLCAILVPQFALVMSLIGSILGSLLCFIFPAFFHLFLFWNHLNYFSKLIRFLIIIIGLIVGIFGVIVSTIRIAETFSY